jgi:hypothetical protein
MRVSLLTLLAAASIAGAAVAQEGGTPPPPSPTVLMSPLALPIVVDGQLVNYVFVTLRLRLSPNADSLKMRAMEPYFRDALVRYGHRKPFVRPDNYTVLDDDKLKAAVLSQAAALVGPGMIASAQVVREQSEHYTGLPKPTAPPRR